MKKILIVLMIIGIFFVGTRKASAQVDCAAILAQASQMGPQGMATIKAAFPGCFNNQGSGAKGTGSGSGLDVFVKAFETAFQTIGTYLGDIAFSIVFGALVLNVAALGMSIVFSDSGGPAWSTAIRGLVLLGLDLDFVSPGSVVNLSSIASDVYNSGIQVGQKLIGYIYSQITVTPPGASALYSNVAKSILPQTFSFDPIAAFDMGLKLAELDTAGVMAHIVSSSSGGLVNAAMAIANVFSGVGLVYLLLGVPAAMFIVGTFSLLAGEIFALIVFSYWTIASIGLVYAFEAIKRFTGKPFSLSVSYSQIYQIIICLFVRVVVMYMILGLGFAAVGPVILGSVTTVSSPFTFLIVIGITFVYMLLAKQAPAFYQIFGCNNLLSSAFVPMAAVGQSLSGGVGGAVGGAVAGHNEAKRTGMPTNSSTYARHMAKSIMSGAKQGANSRQKDPFHAGKEAHDNLADAFKKAEGGPPKSPGGGQQQSPQEEKGGLVDKSGAPVTSASFSPTPSNVRESTKYDGGGQSQGTQQSPQGSFQGPSSPGPQPTPNQPQSGPSGGGSVGGRGGRGSEDSGNSGRIITP